MVKVLILTMRGGRLSITIGWVRGAGLDEHEPVSKFVFTLSICILDVIVLLLASLS